MSEIVSSRSGKAGTLPSSDFALATTEEIINEARNGRMFILVDDEDRENEGDLVIPAQMATPQAINFMAQYGRGLICLALTERRAAELELNLVPARNQSALATAFTVSIEAREGVTTGISAADRARTIAVAINSAGGKDAICSPGHVFPLIARPGGVLIRAGHTEAAVDVARLAGLNPSGVICEIMNDDGSMARLADLQEFARRHGLKIGTIRDLIAYRRRHDHDMVCVAQNSFRNSFGDDWMAMVFRHEHLGTETMVLKKGAIDPSKPTLVRMHPMNIYADILFYGEPGQNPLGRAMKAIAEEGSGVIVLLNRPESMAESVKSPPIHETLQASIELRDYGLGAQILSDLGIQEMVLMTNTHHHVVALEGYGLSIVEERAF